MSQPLSSRIHAANARLISNGDLGSVGEFFAPDYVVHLTEQDLAAGHRTVVAVPGQLRQAFPDIQAEVEILIEGGDRVAWQRTLSGTQQGAYKGFPASGRRLVWRDMVTSRFSGSLIAEEWVLTDLAERLLLSRERLLLSKKALALASCSGQLHARCSSATQVIAQAGCLFFGSY